MGNYMLAFSKATRLAIVTYAIPGQEGHHHVNMNTEAYWIEKFRLFGFLVDRDLTITARNLILPRGVEGRQFREKDLVFKRDGPPFK